MVRLDEMVKSNRPQFLAKVKERRRPNVEEMLREIAFVLHCTRKVKAEILEEHAERKAKMLPRAAAMC